MKNNIRFYFWCRFRLKTNLKEIGHELESLFDDVSSLEWIYNNEIITKFDENEDLKSYTKLKFVLKNNSHMGMQFYSLCRFQLKATTEAIIGELKDLYGSYAPSLENLNNWINENWNFDLIELSNNENSPGSIDLKQTNLVQEENNTNESNQKLKLKYASLKVNLKRALNLLVKSKCKYEKLKHELNFNKKNLNDLMCFILEQAETLNANDIKKEENRNRNYYRKIRDMLAKIFTIVRKNPHGETKLIVEEKIKNIYLKFFKINNDTIMKTNLECLDEIQNLITEMKHNKKIKDTKIKKLSSINKQLNFELKKQNIEKQSKTSENHQCTELITIDD